MKVELGFFREEWLYQPRQHIKKQRHYCANKGLCSQSYSFSSSLVRMWDLDHTESWAPKNWCFQTVALKTHESPLDCQIKPVNPTGNQSWIIIGKADAEAEAPILWSPDVKNWLTGKDPVARKDWGQEEKGTTEDEIVGWHHRLNGHEFEQAPGVGDGQGSLACCSPWGHKESDMTEQLNWTEGQNSSWRIPWQRSLGGLQSTELQRLEHNWSNWVQGQNSSHHLRQRERFWKRPRMEKSISLGTISSWIEGLYTH